MKIAFFVNGIDQIGGAELSTRRLAESLAQRGHEVVLLSTQPLSPRHRKQRLIDYTNRIKLIRLPVWQKSPPIFASMLTLQALWAFPVFLREIQIIHLRGLMPETVNLAILARKYGIKTLCVPMASGPYGDVAAYPSSYPHNLKSFDWVSALTEPLRQEIIEWGVPAARTSIIPNGIDTTRFKPLLNPCGGANIIFVGQFRPEKRVDLLLKAWKLIESFSPQAHLTLVGGGRYLPEYQRYAAQFGITPTFIPNTDEVSVIKHLQANSIFVLPGISEGMSNALLEGMAVGLAPVVSDTPGNRAVITPEIDGLCYDPESPAALAAQLQRLIDNSQLRKRLATEARKKVIERFNLELVTDQYLALYAQILGENP